MVEVWILGPLAAAHDGVPLPLGGQRLQLLTALLATSPGHPVPRSILADELWDEPPADQRHALQSLVSRLRRRLGGHVELHPGGYALVDVDVDGTRFRDESKAGRAALIHGDPAGAVRFFESALAWWRGKEPFADLPATPLLVAESAALAAEHADAARGLIDSHLHLGDHAGAAVLARTRATDEPLAERAWSRLIAALYLCGREVDALHAYEEARAVFRDLLGADPGEHLDTVHRLVLRNAPESDILAAVGGADAAPLRRSGPLPTPHRPALSRPRARRPVPLVGRARETAALHAAAREARSGLRLVTLAGEPGIGKSRLLDEFVRHLRTDGVRVFVSGNSDVPSSAYHPVVQWIRQDTEGLRGSELAERLGHPSPRIAGLVPDLAERLSGVLPAGPAGGAAEQAGQQFLVVEAIVSWMAAAARSGPVCLVLDDAHWADADTLTLVTRLPSYAADLPILIVVAARTTEDPEAPAARVALGRLLTPSQRIDRLDIGPLSADEAAALVGTVLGHDRETSDGAEHARAAEPLREPDTGPGPTAAEIAATAESAGGNPLYLIELAKALGEPADGNAVPGVPSGLRSAIDARARTLPRETFDLLARGAVIGRTFTPALLAAAADRDVLGLDDAITDGVAAGLLEVATDPDLTVSFVHDVVRAALYESVPAVRRASMHAEIADAILRIHGDASAGHLYAIADHYARSAPVAGPGPAVRFLAAAGDHAAEHLAPAVAATMYSRALALAGGDHDPAARCGLMIKLGDAAFLAGDPSYRRTLLDAAALAHSIGAPELLTAAALANNRGWYSSTSDIDRERVAVIESALAVCDPTDRAAHARLLSAWALENVRDPDLRESVLTRSASAFALAEKESAERGDDLLLAHQLADRFSILFATFSAPDECVEVNRRLYAVAHRRNDPMLRLYGAIGITQAAMQLGHHADSVRALDDADQIVSTHPHASREWLVRSWQATLTASRGDLRSAEELVEATLELGLQAEQPDAVTWYSGQLYMLRMMAGRLGEILPAVEEAQAADAEAIPAWRAALAYAFAATGHGAESAGLLEALTGGGRPDLPLDMLWLQGMGYLAFTCGALADQPPYVAAARAAATALKQVLEPMSGMIANNCTIDAGPVDLHLGILARVLGDHRAARGHLDAALAWSRRAGTDTWTRWISAEQDAVR